MRLLNLVLRRLIAPAWIIALVPSTLWGSPLIPVALPDEPVGFIGHGALFDSAGNEIVPSLARLSQVIHSYHEQLAKRLPLARRGTLQSLEKRLLSGPALERQSQLVLETRELQWLVENAQIPDAARLRGKINLIQHLLTRQLPENGDPQHPYGSAPHEVTAELTRRLGMVPLPNYVASPASAALSATSNGGAAYRAECTSKGVPIPPDFGPGSGWVDQGTLSKSDLFIVRGDDAEVMTWTSSSPAGMCIALPRFNDQRTVNADGVICLGVQSSASCYWDNEKLGNTFEFPLGGSRPFSDFGGGTELLGGTGGICSDCHSGENPYVIHGRLLSSLSKRPLSLPTFPVNWDQPLVRTGDTAPWPQNPGPMDSPASCDDCHGSAAAAGDAGRLPQLSTSLPGYCGAVLRSSLGALAPPLPGQIAPPPSMPQGKSAGTLACTPGLPTTDPRYRACSADTVEDCTPDFRSDDPRRAQPDFPAAYQVACTHEISTLLSLCKVAAP